LHKAADETYTMLASKLHNALVYYLKSRNIVKDDTKGRSSYDQSRRVTNEEPTDFDKLVSLICADRLKELIPKSCLDYILAQEKDSWLKHDDLATAVTWLRMNLVVRLSRHTTLSVAFHLTRKH